MKNLNLSKSVDSTGRISIPKKIREQFNINAGDDLDLYTCVGEDGFYYICLKTSAQEYDEIQSAIDVLRAHGYEIPETLSAYLADEEETADE